MQHGHLQSKESMKSFWFINGIKKKIIFKCISNCQLISAVGMSQENICKCWHYFCVILIKNKAKNMLVLISFEFVFIFSRVKNIKLFRYKLKKNYLILVRRRVEFYQYIVAFLTIKGKDEGRKRIIKKVVLSPVDSWLHESKPTCRNRSCLQKDKSTSRCSVTGEEAIQSHILLHCDTLWFTAYALQWNLIN